MLRSACKFLLTLTFSLFSFSAIAEDQCTSKSDDWACFSRIVIQPAATGPTWRMTIFPNQEVLAEIEQGGDVKKYLALASGVQLYWRLSTDESISGGANPFAFLDLGFSLPITALRGAFPLGPASVAVRESRKDVVVEDRPITISATRRGEQITYRLESGSTHITGLWERVAPDPLPDSYSLVGWVSSTNVQFPTLKEARSAPH
jgi:hypothetical protein